MRLIIDSGATKTEYLLVDRQEVLFHFSQAGINANYMQDTEIAKLFSDTCKELPEELLAKISHIHFYGAGCGKEENARRIEQALYEHFPTASIAVYSDLLAACHALLGEQAGWVGILGTGSSSCYYDGSAIACIAPSLGYLLGDEGSGTHLGKLFLTYYLEDLLPVDVKQLFEKRYQLDIHSVIENLYRKSSPNRFISSLSPFIVEHIHVPVVAHMCRESFDEFFKKQKRYYQKNNILIKEISLIGSVACHFQDILLEAAGENQISVREIMASPINELGRYYQNKMK